MPIGVNANGNLNVYLFEVGLIVRDPDTGDEKVHVVGIHPLLVAPRDVSYNDTSRSPTVQTGTGSVTTVSGRALRTVQMRGSWGIETRGLGPYLGTGFVRAKRFYDECVRLPDALDKDDLKEATDILRGTPFLKLLLLPYQDEKTVFYVNFYDFFRERKFSARIPRYTDSTHFDRGGASGLIHYEMTIQEEGPLVTGSLATLAIGLLFKALTTWSAVNDVILTYAAPGAIVGSFAAVGAILLQQFNDTLGAVKSNIDIAVALLSNGPGAVTARSDGMAAFLSQAATLEGYAQDLVDAFSSSRNEGGGNEFEGAPGRVEWAEVEGEGSNYGLDAADEIAALEDLAFAARFQRIAGNYYGMSETEYQAYLASNGAGATAPVVRGSVEYTVGPSDTEETIEAQFGVGFDLVLDLNRLTPDEALLVGTVLQIPVRRGVGPQPIDGLPTLGSHVGRAAWGTDLPVDLSLQAGDHRILRDEPVLVQGVDWVITTFGSELQEVVNSVPSVVQHAMLQARLERLLLQDKRVASVDQVVAESVAGEALLALRVDLTAINGVTITTGSPRA